MGTHMFAVDIDFQGDRLGEIQVGVHGHCCRFFNPVLMVRGPDMTLHAIVPFHWIFAVLSSRATDVQHVALVILEYIHLITSPGASQNTLEQRCGVMCYQRPFFRPRRHPNTNSTDRRIVSRCSIASLTFASTARIIAVVAGGAGGGVRAAAGPFRRIRITGRIRTDVSPLDIAARRRPVLTRVQRFLQSIFAEDFECPRQRGPSGSRLQSPARTCAPPHRDPAPHSHRCPK